MKSPEGTVTAVPSAAVMIQVTIDTGRATKMPARDAQPDRQDSKSVKLRSKGGRLVGGYCLLLERTVVN